MCRDDDDPDGAGASKSTDWLGAYWRFQNILFSRWKAGITYFGSECATDACEYEGNPGIGGGEAGDLFLKVTVGEKQGFERKGNDVYTTINVPFSTAVCGGEAVIKTLYGNVICKIREGMQSGSKIRLRGKGIVSMKNPSVRGDQYVTIQIQVPQNLNYTAKEKLHEYAKACGLERSNATGSHVA